MGWAAVPLTWGVLVCGVVCGVVWVSFGSRLGLVWVSFFLRICKPIWSRWVVGNCGMNICSPVGIQPFRDCCS